MPAPSSDHVAAARLEPAGCVPTEFDCRECQRVPVLVQLSTRVSALLQNGIQILADSENTRLQLERSSDPSADRNYPFGRAALFATVRITPRSRVLFQARRLSDAGRLRAPTDPSPGLKYRWYSFGTRSAMNSACEDWNAVVCPYPRSVGTQLRSRAPTARFVTLCTAPCGQG